MGAPSVGPAAPTSHTGGTSVPTTPQPMPQPMTSSYQGNEQVLASPRPQRLTPDEAALIMADHLPKVRVLGVVDPGPAGRPYASAGLVTGQVHTAVNPQVTINSSLSSPPVPAITNGAGGDFASSGAAVFTTDVANATPTTAAIAVTPGMFAAGAANATVSSAAVPATTAASTAGTTTTGTTIGTTSAATTTPTTAASTITPTSTATGNVRGLNTTATNGNVSISTVNGKVTVSNVKSQ